MAQKKVVKENEIVNDEIDTEVIEQEDTIDIDKFSMEQKVLIKNLANWQVAFKRLDGVGDVLLAPKGSMRISRNEIILQVQNGNKMLAGTDGYGSNATIFIDDKETRVYLEFETMAKDSNQNIITDKKLTDLFQLNGKQFENAVKDTIKTSAEKDFVNEAIVRLKLSNTTSWDKLQFVKDYCAFKL